jgi:hypothetical protein
MAAGKFGGQTLAISFDDGPGGTLRVITPFVREIGGVKVESITEETHPFGVSYKENTPVGLVEIADITIKGKWDTTLTTGPHVVFKDPDDGPQDATRSFVFAPGDSKTFTAECRLVSYDVIGTVGKISEYEAVIRFTGTPTGWA